MEPNKMQIGGTHYRKKYQHWDWVCDTNMPYLLGCATKYVARWRDKNGVEDLRKSMHYLAKAEERGVHMPVNNWGELLRFNTTEKLTRNLTGTFCSQLGTEDSTIIRLIVEGSYDTGIIKISELIESELAAEPGASYTNQDPNYIKG
jgi:hypothetical protein